MDGARAVANQRTGASRGAQGEPAAPGPGLDPGRCHCSSNDPEGQDRR